MIDLNTALRDQFLGVAAAEGLAQIPEDGLGPAVA
jgi:hypothetical protein